MKPKPIYKKQFGSWISHLRNLKKMNMITTQNRAELARQKFKDKGLDYTKVTNIEVARLLEILNKHLKSFNRENHPDFYMRICMIRKMDLQADRLGLLFLHIRVRSYYFFGREAITFNKDGFIGFCGWASSSNQKPIVDAFEEWVSTFKN